MRAALASLIAGCLLPANLHAEAEAEAHPERPSPVAVGVDLVIVRPLGLVATVVGAVLFVPVAVVSAPNGRDGLQHAWEVFVGVPAGHVFRRPLGDF